MIQTNSLPTCDLCNVPFEYHPHGEAVVDHEFIHDGASYNRSYRAFVRDAVLNDITDEGEAT